MGVAQEITTKLNFGVHGIVRFQCSVHDVNAAELSFGVRGMEMRFAIIHDRILKWHSSAEKCRANTATATCMLVHECREYNSSLSVTMHLNGEVEIQ